MSAKAYIEIDGNQYLVTNDYIAARRTALVINLSDVMFIKLHSIQKAKGFNFIKIDWGDETLDKFSDTNLNDVYHIYQQPGKYVIQIENASNINVTNGDSEYNNIADVLESIAYSGDLLTTIDDNAFKNCVHLKSAVFSQYLRTIGESAFNGCSQLNDIVIPYGTKNIMYESFSSCSNLKNFKFGNSTKIIEPLTFAHCHSLKNINIDSGVVNIGSCAFFDCTNLESVVFSNTVKTIDTYAFWNCQKLKSIYLPKNVEKLNSFAFYNCTSLTDVKLTQGITTIESNTFDTCSSLRSITIPKTIKNIETHAFSDCQNLDSIIFEGNAPTHLNSTENYMPFFNINQNAVGYIKPTAKGFSLDSTGKWNNLRIQVI